MMGQLPESRLRGPSAMTSPHLIRVAVVDDHRYVHQAVTAILSHADDVVLVAQGTTGVAAIELCEQHQPDILLMDIVMPEMDGVEAARIIRERFPQIKILVLSSFQDHDSVYQMLRLGASGYLVKGSLASDLVSTIRSTYAGRMVLSPEAAQHLLTRKEASSPADIALTSRELEVLGLMAEGLSNGRIAAELEISQSTVKFHISNILEKLGADTRAEGLVLAARSNLI